jgi:transposase
MDTASTQASERIIGIDLGDKASHFCEVTETGDVREQGRFPATPAGVRRCFASGPRARIALETGGQSAWVARLLTSFGHSVLIANARKLRMIFGE